MKTNLLTNLSSKALSLVVLLAVVTAEAKATEACLNPVEQGKYETLTTAKAEAVAERPGCEKAYGAAGCLSPFEETLLRGYVMRLTECRVLGPDSQLIGDWTIVARVCEGSGRPADDNFVIGRDEAKLSIRSLDSTGATLGVRLSTQIRDLPLYSKVGKILASGLSVNKLAFGVVDSETGRTTYSIAEVDLTPNPTLILSTDGFGIGGSCAIGETLKTYLRK